MPSRWSLSVTIWCSGEVGEDLHLLPHSFIGPAEGEGVYLSATNDNYDAARLFLLDTVRKLQVKGAHW
jgi:hypothetical protein